MSPPKCCAVCGDKALGYNFNAVTCESCKAFFRRNALAQKQFTCPFNQNCDITVVTRRFCQKCRLKKCLDIGMKSENIMSEEDKQIKRRKIETNRAKRRLTEQKTPSGGSASSTRHEQQQAAADSSGYDAYAASYDSQSCGSFDSANGVGPSGAQRSNSRDGGVQPSSSTTPHDELNPELMTGEDIVDFIVCDPDKASQAISKLMRTPSEAFCTMEKIINSQKDALKLISHLIAYPGDALKIISKFMNSPFNALTVFTKFMSSPTDALEIISKMVSSPQDVLQFIRNLMDSPEDALDIMNKFMNTPAEALKIINKIFNGPNPHENNNNNNSNELILPTAVDAGAFAADDNNDNDISESPPFQSPITPQSQMHSPEEAGLVVTENAIIHSMLLSSPPTGMVVMSPPPTQTNMMPQQSPLTPFTPSPQSMSISSPASVEASISSVGCETQFHSPSSHQQLCELPSTSTVLMMPPISPTTAPTTTTTIAAAASSSNNITTTPPDAEVIPVGTADFASENFDIKTFIQNTFPENPNGGDSLNSLESVLTEVIRIEFQAFNNLQQLPSSRVKEEQQPEFQLLSQRQQQNCRGGGGCAVSYNSCNAQQQQPICAPSSVIMGRDLNEAEQLKLRELKLASEALYYPVDDDLSVLMGNDIIKHEDPTQQDPKLLQVINLTAVAIKRLIKMAKKIGAFRDMCQEDQVALLKGGCTEMMIMRSVMNYDNNRAEWKIPHTKEDMSIIGAEVLKLAKGNVYEEHLKFIRTFDEKWRLDENIILIMCAIVLFMPTRPRIIHSDVIRLEQNSYYYLLRRYLESVYPGCEAKSTFIKLIQKISDVERLNQFIIGVYLNVNPAQVEPLLREIFDMKNH